MVLALTVTLMSDMTQIVSISLTINLTLIEGRQHAASALGDINTTDQVKAFLDATREPCTMLSMMFSSDSRRLQVWSATGGPCGSRIADLDVTMDELFGK